MKLVAILLYLKSGCVCECDHMHMRSVNMQDVVLCCVVLCQVKPNVITD